MDNINISANYTDFEVENNLDQITQVKIELKPKENELTYSSTNYLTLKNQINRDTFHIGC
jgi:hypothetical protein